MDRWIPEGQKSNVALAQAYHDGNLCSKFG